MASLYDIDSRLLLYQEEFDPETGEWKNEDEWNALMSEFNEKIEDLACWAKDLRADEKKLREESKYLIERADILAKRATRIEDAISARLNGKPFSTSRVDIKFSKSTAVEITDEDAVPDEYAEYKTTRSIRKTDLKKFLKGLEGSNESVPWARLIHKNNMKIK